MNGLSVNENDPGRPRPEQSLTMDVLFTPPFAQGIVCDGDYAASPSWTTAWMEEHGKPVVRRGWEIRDWEIMPRGSPLFATKQMGGATFKLWHVARPYDAPPPVLSEGATPLPPLEDTD